MIQFNDQLSVNMCLTIFDAPNCIRSWVVGRKDIEKEIQRHEENMALSMAKLTVQCDKRLLNCDGANVFVTWLIIEYIPGCLALLFACSCERINANWSVVRVTSEDPRLRKSPLRSSRTQDWLFVKRVDQKAKCNCS